MILSTLTSVYLLSPASLNAIPLSCISMNNQECKVRSQIVYVNSKSSGSCNNINNLYPNLCLLDVVKKLNVPVFNLMSRTNERRYIEWLETCKCKCRLDASNCNNK